MYNIDQFIMFASDARVMSYINKNSSLNIKKPFSERSKDKNEWKKLLKTTLKWLKILGFLFIIISMLWGCVQMYQSPFLIQEVTDLTGRKVFATGISFEIVIGSLGEKPSQNWESTIIGNLEGTQYVYNVISSWGEAFSKTGSPFYGFFVYPTALLLNSFIYIMSGTLTPELDDKGHGVAVLFGILFTVVVIKSFTLLFTWKSQVNQERQQSIQLKTAEIQAKYKGDKSPQARQKQQIEMQALYKKEGFSPFSAMAGAFASMPFLFAMYAIVRSTKSLKLATIGLVSLIDKPWTQITQGQWVYLAILCVYLPLQIMSMLLPLILQSIKQKTSTLTEAQKKSRKKQFMMQGLFSLMFIVIVVSVASGVAIYWILSSSFQICQTLGFHFYNQRKANRSVQEVNRRRQQEARRQAKNKTN